MNGACSGLDSKDITPHQSRVVGRLTMRRARADESAQAYRIKRDSLVPHQVSLCDWDESEQWRAHERRFATQDYYLLEEAGKPVGVMALVVGLEQIRLNQFFVMPDCHGRGIGTAALCALTTEADGVGLSVRLDVARDNQRAIALYENFGFRMLECTGDRVAMLRSPG